MKPRFFRWLVWTAVALALAGTWAWYFHHPVRWTLATLLSFCGF
jgi:hypothetical protein